MNKISIDELEQKIESGEEIIDTYFNPDTTRVGEIYPVITRRNSLIKKTLEIPHSMVEEIETLANQLNISSDAVIKMMLRRSLDEHYLAKNH
jgi:hypothetical protein